MAACCSRSIRAIDDVVRDAIAVLRAVPPTADEFTALSTESEKYRVRLGQPFPKELSLALKAVGPAGMRLTETADLIASIHRDQPGPVRAAAADVLARGAWNRQRSSPWPRRSRR